MSERDEGYGYAWSDWLAAEDPAYVEANQALNALIGGPGRELSIKHKEMIMIGVLAFRGRQDAVAAHMRRALAHGASKGELIEALHAAALPGGGPTRAVGIMALMQLEAEGAFGNR